MNALTPIARPRETDAERRDRQLDMLREMAELGMQMARAATARALDAEPPNPDQPAAADPNLAFARATRAARQAIALETRIAAGDPARSTPARAAPPAPDPRRPALRQALQKLAESEPERAARAQLRRHIDERIEEELLADPDGHLPLGEAFAAICDDLGLDFDASTLSDEFLGLACDRPGWNQPGRDSPDQTAGDRRASIQPAHRSPDQATPASGPRSSTPLCGELRTREASKPQPDH